MWRKSLGALAVTALVAAGCSDDDGSEPEQASEPDQNGSQTEEGSADNSPIALWTVYDTSDRIATMEGVLGEFTAQSGIDVELTGVSAGDLSQAMISAAAAGDLPDVVVHGSPVAADWLAEGILDPAAATEVIEELNPETFSPGALELVAVEGEEGQYSTVPSDGWGQMIFYRTDLFEQAGLEPPTTYERVLTAAEELDGDGMNGFALGNAGGNPFTWQVMEHFALANDCHLVNDAGDVTLDSPECEEMVRFYADLNEFAPTGAGDVDTTRANYLAGTAAMVSWSPHLLDELAGLFPDTPPTCEQCADDPAWLVERTGIAPLLQGPSGDQPTQYGITINLGITTSADVEPAQELVRYLLSDGYSGFLSISPEGRFPMRNGPEPGDTSYVDGWSELAVGSGGKTATVGELYGQEAVDTIAQSATGFEGWGVSKGHGELLAALRGDYGLTTILRDVLDGTISPDEAVTQMAETADQVASELD